nr:FtsK/SpoIIIE domain-containing protein [Ureibacillus chungkukjangi]
MYVKNLTNIFTDVNQNNISQRLRKTIEQSQDGVSGVEILMKRGVTNFTLVSPPFLRNNSHRVDGNKKQVLENSKFYEGYLSRPFFLPICDTLNGEFIGLVKLLSEALNEDESIYIQWLFTKAYNWKDTAIEMYSSYILGNDHPLPFKVARKFQDKSLKLFNKLGSTSENRSYIEEAEQKIASEGYRFQLRVGINCSSSRLEYLISRVENLFKQYTFYNSIKLAKVNSKNITQQIEECVVSPDSKFQILTLREILSLFGGNDIEVNNEEVAEVVNEVRDKVNSVIELLPNYPMQEVPERDGIVQDIAEALKRVGLTQQARVYNASVITGVRLTVVQADIPKGLNLTNLTSKTVDIQAALGVNSLGIEQGDVKDTVKFSIPNEKPAIVALRTLLEHESFKQYSRENKLAFVCGLSEINEPIYLSLTKLIHLLISGKSGSGKSIFVNGLVTTLTLTHTPQELKLILIDPKMVELQHFENFLHVDSVITDMDKAEGVLGDLTKEMDNRYSIFKKAGTKNINLYNEKVLNGELEEKEIMPFIVCVIDEYADLYSTHSIVEKHIERLGSKSRAAGIHIVLCTQRPSSDIVSGRIKANVANAISFNLTTSNNYKTVFGTGIPYTLLNKGDGCFKVEGWSKEFQRFQSAIISPDESEEERVYKELAEYLKKQYSKPNVKSTIEEEFENEDENDQEDENLNKLKKIIANTKETRTTELRKMLGVKNTTLSSLMKRLVDENWLEIGKSKQEGYKLIIDEDERVKWEG